MRKGFLEAPLVTFQESDGHLRAGEERTSISEIVEDKDIQGAIAVEIGNAAVILPPGKSSLERWFP